LEQTIGRIAGVAKVEVFGGRGRELSVLLDPGALQSLRVDPFRVVEALRADNFSLPLGWLEHGGRRSLVRATAHLDSLGQVSRLPLAPPIAGTDSAGQDAAGAQPARGGPLLRLGDVGRVALREKERQSWSKVEGRAAVMMAVYKETAANTVAVGRAVSRTVEEDFPRDPLLRGLEIHPMFAEDKVISQALASLQQTALWGAVFASLVLLAFFQGLVPTLLVMAAVPISLLFTLVWMFFLGVSINIISMTGLMLALGMLVDNAVVVTENTARLSAAGASPTEAAQRGTGEVGIAIVMGTLTTVIVFLPLPLLGSGTFLTFIFRQLSYPIVLSLLGSLLVATLFVPLAARMLLTRVRLTEPRWFAPLRKGYRRLLRRMLARRLDATLLLVLALVSVALPAGAIKWDLFGSRGARHVRVKFDHSPVFGLAQTEGYFDRLMARLEPRRGELGIRVATVRYRRGGGTLSLFLQDTGRKQRDMEQFLAQLRELIGEEPGVGYTIRGSQGREEERMLTVRLFGPRPEVLRDLAESARQATRDVPGLGEMILDEERPPREVAVVIDRRRAERHGITARQAAQRVSAALRGTSALPKYRLKESEIEVVVRQDLRGQGLGALANLRLEGSSGPLPLQAVARLEFRGAPDTYTRRDGRISLSLEGRLEGDDFAATQREVNQRMAAMTFPKGYGWGRGDKGMEFNEDRASMNVVLLLALGAIFMVMGVLFESFLLPATVLVTIPLAFLGSVWMLYLTGTAMDTTGMIGMVILAGVVVNNGIVLVDRINRNRREGMELEEAILAAGDVRLRPILMTALTTIFGLLPMVFGFTNVAGYSFVAMGRVVTGGLLAATVLTLFVVPLTYHLLARVEAVVRGEG
ncbi:MAG: efflux RND transporter permease subunit, partial [bacterium]